MRILADENIPQVEARFGALGEVGRFAGRELRSSDLADVELLLVRSVTRVDRQLLQGSKVRFVGTATSGIDHLDLDYLRGQGIGFANAPGSNGNSVVEYVLCAIAEAGDKLEQLLSGRARVGIVGYGVIGKMMAARLSALGIAHCAYDPWLDDGAIPNAASLQEVLQCEVITLHCELTDEMPWPSRNLLNGATLVQLREGALLINASRGPVIDNIALLELVQQRDDLTVVLDVWEREPEVMPELLQRVLIGTPHIAGYSYDGKLLAVEMLLRAASESLGLPCEPAAAEADTLDVITPRLDLNRADFVRALLRQRYDIFADDRALRQVVIGCSAELAARDFDVLRKNYPVRRELCASTVMMAGGQAEQRALALALGCEVGEAK
jgi:erythronate-4-phosphate dehydrogenase